jgi:hypothetical protein
MRIRSELVGVLRYTRHPMKWLRQWLPGMVAIILIAATIAAVVWLHSAARSSPDAWPTSVAAGTTAALALITLWYAYLTHRLLSAQRASPRLAGWETALRDLSLYLNRKNKVLWALTDIFPLGAPGVDPPSLKLLMKSRDSLRGITEHLLEIVGLLPRDFVGKVLGLTARLADAESEVYALLVAMTEVQMQGLDEGRKSWSWDEVQSAHEASEDPDRSEPWTDIARGRFFHAAEAWWDDLSSEVDRHLTGSPP